MVICLFYKIPPRDKNADSVACRRRPFASWLQLLFQIYPLPFSSCVGHTEVLRVLAHLFHTLFLCHPWPRPKNSGVPKILQTLADPKGTRWNNFSKNHTPSLPCCIFRVHDIYFYYSSAFSKSHLSPTTALNFTLYPHCQSRLKFFSICQKAVKTEQWAMSTSSIVFCALHQWLVALTF